MQSIDGVQSGRFLGGVEAEDEADEYGEEEGAQDGGDGEHRGEGGHQGNDFGDGYAEEDADNPPATLTVTDSMRNWMIIML